MPPFCDIPADPHNTDEIAMPIKKRRFYGIKAGLLPVPGCGFLLYTDGLAGLHHLQVAQAAVESAVMRKDLIIGLSHDPGLFESRKLLKGLIDQYVSALNVFEIDDIRDGIYQGLVMDIQLSKDIICRLLSFRFIFVLHDASCPKMLYP